MNIKTIIYLLLFLAVALLLLGWLIVILFPDSKLAQFIKSLSKKFWQSPWRFILHHGLGSFLILSSIAVITAHMTNCILDRGFTDFTYCTRCIFVEGLLWKPLGRSVNSEQILLFSLALIVASITYAMTLWRGSQTREQIIEAQKQTKLTQDQIEVMQLQSGLTQEQIEETQKQSTLTQTQVSEIQKQAELSQKQVSEAQRQAELTQRQIEQTRFQSALELATEKENAARCISGLRALEGMYESLSDADKESIYSVALYVLSLPKEGERKVSRTVRQWALDILIDKGFLSQKSLVSRLRDREGSIEMSVQETMIGKDLSLLYFARQSKEKDSEGNKILDLSGFSFRSCDFFGANISNIDFTGADFTDASLIGTDVTNSKFYDPDEWLIKNLEWAYYSGKDNEKPEGLPDGVSISTWKEWRENIKEAINTNMQVKPNNLLIMPEQLQRMGRFADKHKDYPAGKSNP